MSAARGHRRRQKERERRLDQAELARALAVRWVEIRTDEVGNEVHFVMPEGRVVAAYAPEPDVSQVPEPITHAGGGISNIPRDGLIRKRAKKIMQGLLMTQKIADGRQREEAWLRARRDAEKFLIEEGAIFALDPLPWVAHGGGRWDDNTDEFRDQFRPRQRYEQNREAYGN